MLWKWKCIRMESKKYFIDIRGIKNNVFQFKMKTKACQNYKNNLIKIQQISLKKLQWNLSFMKQNEKVQFFYYNLFDICYNRSLYFLLSKVAYNNDLLLFQLF